MFVEDYSYNQYLNDISIIHHFLLIFPFICRLKQKNLSSQQIMN